MNKKQLIVVWMVFVFIALVFIVEAQAASYKTKSFEKAGNSYSVEVKYPEIIDERLKLDVRQSLNKEIGKFVHGLFDEDLKTFVENSSQWTKEELKGIAGRDLAAIDFKAIRLDDRFVSIRFEKYSYGIGAAHGLTHISGFNYDLKQMKQVNLADLFKPGSEYLKQISDYCIQDLSKQLNKESDAIRDNWIKEGAAPKEENLREFTIDKDSLIVYFNDYQVADYASGTKQVNISFKKLFDLKSLIR